MAEKPVTSGPAVECGLRIRLYVAGDAPNSTTALDTLRSVIAQRSIQVELEVIDVLTEPERGLRDGVLFTPMLVRVAPPPERRILGNLSNRATLLGVLAPGCGPFEPLEPSVRGASR
jgi:circadian clock protein KaiB